MFLSLRLWSSLLQTHVAVVGTAYLICLQDMYVIYTLVPFVFVSKVTHANIISFELPFSFSTFYANFLLFNRAIRYFGLQVHAAIKNLRMKP